MSRPTVSFYLLRAEEAGISWPADDGLDDNQIKELLFGKSRPKNCQRLYQKTAPPGKVAALMELPTIHVSVTPGW